MGLLDAVFGDGSKELLKVLELLPHGNAKTRESDFRDLAHRFLLELGDIEVKREAGVQAKGTRIDLYAHYRSIDYLITIKKGLSEQKVKNIIGECSVLMANWRPTVSGKKTYIVLLPFALSTPTEFPEYMQPYAKFAGQNTNRNFELTFTLPMGDLSDE
jgi:hypothetical protein